MSLSVDIDRMHVAARLTGQADDAGVLDRRLCRMLVDEVLPAVSADDALRDAEAIYCLPDLALHLQMTLQEALSAEGSRRWSKAFLDALHDRLSSASNMWQFDNRWDYVASYLRARLAVMRVPDGVFTGFTALDLLTPAQAVQEALREWPEIWAYLGRGAAKEAEKVARALKAQGGSPIMTAILRDAIAPTATAGTMSVGAVAADFAAEVTRLAQAPTPALIGSLRRAPSDDAVCTAFFLALCAADTDRPGHNPAMGLFLSLLARATTASDAAPVDVPWLGQLHRAVSELPQPLRASAHQIVETVAVSPNFEAQLNRLVRKLRDPSSATDVSEATTSTTPRDRSDQTQAQPQPGPAQTDKRVYFSPIAGVALCLPLLAENRIGLDFPAKTRLEALARLAGLPDTHVPLDDPLLNAIAGQDDKEDLPDRPREMDLLFVPEERRATIQSAAPGAPRLAAWLEARLAAALPGLSGSSLGFLQSHFLHRAGCLTVTSDSLRLDLDPMPLRSVLGMSHLVGPDLARADWLDGQMISILIRPEAT